MGKGLFGKVAVATGKFLWEVGKGTAKALLEEGKKHGEQKRQEERVRNFEKDVGSFSDVKLSEIVMDSSAEPQEKELAMRELERKAKSGEPFSDVAIDAINQHRDR